MSANIQRCRICGDRFYLTQEQLELWEDGWIDKPDVCSDCGGYYEEPEEEDEQRRAER